MESTQVLMDCTQVLDEAEPESTVIGRQKVGLLEINNLKYDIFIGENVIGRDQLSDIVISNPSISSKHAVIEVEDDCETHSIMDLGSLNKTRLGKKVLKANKSYTFVGDISDIMFADLPAKYTKFARPQHFLNNDDDSGSETGSESMLNYDPMKADCDLEEIPIKIPPGETSNVKKNKSEALFELSDSSLFEGKKLNTSARNNQVVVETSLDDSTDDEELFVLPSQSVREFSISRQESKNVHSKKCNLLFTEDDITETNVSKDIFDMETQEQDFVIPSDKKQSNNVVFVGDCDTQSVFEYTKPKHKNKYEQNLKNTSLNNDSNLSGSNHQLKNIYNEDIFEAETEMCDEAETEVNRDGLLGHHIKKEDTTYDIDFFEAETQRNNIYMHKRTNDKQNKSLTVSLSERKTESNHNISLTEKNSIKRAVSATKGGSKLTENSDLEMSELVLSNTSTGTNRSVENLEIEINNDSLSLDNALTQVNPNLLVAKTCVPHNKPDKEKCLVALSNTLTGTNRSVVKLEIGINDDDSLSFENALTQVNPNLLVAKTCVPHNEPNKERCLVSKSNSDKDYDEDDICNNLTQVNHALKKSPNEIIPNNLIKIVELKKQGLIIKEEPDSDDSVENMQTQINVNKQEINCNNATLQTVSAKIIKNLVRVVKVEKLDTNNDSNDVLSDSCAVETNNHKVKKTVASIKNKKISKAKRCPQISDLASTSSHYEQVDQSIGLISDVKTLSIDVFQDAATEPYIPLQISESNPKVIPTKKGPKCKTNSSSTSEKIKNTGKKETLVISKPNKRKSDPISAVSTTPSKHEQKVVSNYVITGIETLSSDDFQDAATQPNILLQINNANLERSNMNNEPISSLIENTAINDKTNLQVSEPHPKVSKMKKEFKCKTNTSSASKKVKHKNKSKDISKGGQSEVEVYIAATLNAIDTIEDVCMGTNSRSTTPGSTMIINRTEVVADEIGCKSSFSGLIDAANTNLIKTNEKCQELVPGTSSTVSISDMDICSTIDNNLHVSARSVCESAKKGYNQIKSSLKTPALQSEFNTNSNIHYKDPANKSKKSKNLFRSMKDTNETIAMNALVIGPCSSSTPFKTNKDDNQIKQCLGRDILATPPKSNIPIVCDSPVLPSSEELLAVADKTPVNNCSQSENKKTVLSLALNRTPRVRKPSRKLVEEFDDIVYECNTSKHKRKNTSSSSIKKNSNKDTHTLNNIDIPNTTNETHKTLSLKLIRCSDIMNENSDKSCSKELDKEENAISSHSEKEHVESSSTKSIIPSTSKEKEILLDNSNEQELDDTQSTSNTKETFGKGLLKSEKSQNNLKEHEIKSDTQKPFKKTDGGTSKAKSTLETMSAEVIEKETSQEKEKYMSNNNEKHEDLENIKNALNKSNESNKSSSSSREMHNTDERTPVLILTKVSPPNLVQCKKSYESLEKCVAAEEDSTNMLTNPNKSTLNINSTITSANQNMVSVEAEISDNYNIEKSEENSSCSPKRQKRDNKYSVLKSTNSKSIEKSKALKENIEIKRPVRNRKKKSYVEPSEDINESKLGDNLAVTKPKKSKRGQNIRNEHPPSPVNLQSKTCLDENKVEHHKSITVDLSTMEVDENNCKISNDFETNDSFDGGSICPEQNNKNKRKLKIKICNEINSAKTMKLDNTSNKSKGNLNTDKDLDQTQKDNTGNSSGTSTPDDKKRTRRKWKGNLNTDKDLDQTQKGNTGYSSGTSTPDDKKRTRRKPARLEGSVSSEFNVSRYVRTSQRPDVNEMPEASESLETSCTGGDTITNESSSTVPSATNRCQKQTKADNKISIDTSNMKKNNLIENKVRSRSNSVASQLSNSSRSSTPRRSVKKGEKVLFTCLSDPDLESTIKKLGGSVVDCPSVCSVLVTDKVRRTVKFLCALGQGKPIVTSEWITQSWGYKRFEEPTKYLLKDRAAERKFQFCLSTTLDEAKKEPFLSGFSVHATASVQPPPEDIKKIVESCGGVYLDEIPSKWPQQSVVVSHPDDKALWKKLKVKGVTPPLVLAEMILLGVLQNKLDLEKHRIV